MDHPVPPVLYKFCRATPEHIQIVSGCHIRFSQRQVFEDYEEFRPPVAGYGSQGEFWHWIESDAVLRHRPRQALQKIYERMANDPEHLAKMVEQTRGFMSALDEFVALCITENPDNERMWNEYASESKGFVIAFETDHPTFRLLREPGRLGKVEYSDEPIPSLLAANVTATFFRKRTHYSFEAEWRILRAIKRFNRIVPTPKGPCYLAPFDPACVKEILTRKECAVENDLQRILASDSTYAHIQLRRVGIEPKFPNPVTSLAIDPKPKVNH